MVKDRIVTFANTLIVWAKARRGEISTKVGLVLGGASAAIDKFAPINPKLTYAGIFISALLVLWKEKSNG